VNVCSADLPAGNQVGETQGHGRVLRHQVHNPRIKLRKGEAQPVTNVGLAPATGVGNVRHDHGYK
jgi:hypothetical protein